MQCHNCGNLVPETANFCLQCGAPAPHVRQVISIPIDDEPTLVRPVAARPTAVPRGNGVLIGVSIALIGLLIGATFAGLWWFNRPRTVATINTSEPPTIATPTPTPKPRIRLLDQIAAVEPGEHYALPFTVPNSGMRLLGGFVVQDNNFGDVYVYPADVYESSYPTNALKPVHLEQARNKKVNAALPRGQYVLVFENNGDVPINIAAEFWLE